jgi:hypothetical protein
VPLYTTRNGAGDGGDAGTINRYVIPLACSTIPATGFGPPEPPDEPPIGGTTPPPPVLAEVVAPLALVPLAALVPVVPLVAPVAWVLDAPEAEVTPVPLLPPAPVVAAESPQAAPAHAIDRKKPTVEMRDILQTYARSTAGGVGTIEPA